jgi:hypothetical protein
MVLILLNILVAAGKIRYNESAYKEITGMIVSADRYRHKIKLTVPTIRANPALSRIQRGIIPNTLFTVCARTILWVIPENS